MIESIFLASFLITGVHVAVSWEGMIFFFVKVRYEKIIEWLMKVSRSFVACKKVDIYNHSISFRFHMTGYGYIIIAAVWLMKMIQKPLFDCLPCMASIWGSLCWFILLHQSINLFYFAFILAVAGVNTIISAIIQFTQMKIFHE